MATSGSTDWTLTSRQVITEALENIGAITLGDEPAEEDAAKALSVFNQMLKTWATTGKLFTKAEGSVTLLASTASYASTPVTLARRIIEVRRRTANVDTVLTPYSRDDYFAEPSKTATGLPRAWYFDPQRATRTLYVVGVPDAAIAASTTLRFTYERVIEDSDALDNDPDVPQEWMETLVHSLAARLIVPYRKHITDAAGAAYIEQRAAMLYAQLSADSEEDASVFMQPAFN